ncbi:DUF998 domain-containing protein [Hyphococcus sp.]|uniref:DUF998 domain-containing protein n=1 Tax=Hyphococcus sp. TaxID=2038636 RepID=UPI0037511BC0
MSILAAMLLLAAGVVLPMALGSMWPDYNWTANYLSELGATGAPHGFWMTYGGFLPVSIFWTLSIVLFYLRSPKSSALLAGVCLLLGTSVSYFGAVLFRCDLGCPIEGSESQVMHNLLGVIGYLATPPALILIGLHFNKTGQKLLGSLTFLTAALCIAGFVGMATPENADFRGLSQRMADFSLFGWVAAVAFLLKQKAAA